MANEVLKTLYDPNFDVNTLSDLYLINEEDTFQSDDDRIAIKKILDGFYKDWEQKQYMAMLELSTLIELEEIFSDKGTYLTNDKLVDFVETGRLPYIKSCARTLNNDNESNKCSNKLEEYIEDDNEYAI